MGRENDLNESAPMRKSLQHALAGAKEAPTVHFVVVARPGVRLRGRGWSREVKLESLGEHTHGFHAHDC